MLGLGVCHGVESANAHYLSDRVTASIIGIRVSTKDAAEIRLQPEFVRCLALLASFVDAVAFDSTGNRDMNSHVQSRKGIVAAREVVSMGTSMDGKLRTRTAPQQSWKSSLRCAPCMSTY